MQIIGLAWFSLTRCTPASVPQCKHFVLYIMCTTVASCMEVKNEYGRKGCSFRRRSGVQWQGVFWYKCNKIDTFQIYQWLPYERQLICDFWSITLLKFLVKFPIISFTHHISFSATPSPNNNWCRKVYTRTLYHSTWCTEQSRENQVRPWYLLLIFILPYTLICKIAQDFDWYKVFAWWLINTEWSYNQSDQH